MGIKRVGLGKGHYHMSLSRYGCLKRDGLHFTLTYVCAQAQLPFMTLYGEKRNRDVKRRIGT